MAAKVFITCLACLGGLLVLTVINGRENTQGYSTATSATPAVAARPNYSPLIQPLHAPEPVPDTKIARIIDGDTFELSDGTEVRVLGINSCEMDTVGGPQAKEAAEILLRSPQVALTPEPGVDLDPWGRQLRYVQLADGRDFGLTIVTGTHTGVYEGRNDASAMYMAYLRGADQVSGRDCGGPLRPDPPPVVADHSTDDYHYVPTPRGNDGGESWFCRKRRWC